MRKWFSEESMEIGEKVKRNELSSEESAMTSIVQDVTDKVNLLLKLNVPSEEDAEEDSLDSSILACLQSNISIQYNILSYIFLIFVFIGN